MVANFLSYAIVTPARNEADFIEDTLKSVVGQSVLPVRWVIVSDGSTDGTDEIVSRYATSHPWIELVRMPPRSQRDFAGKVYAFNAGYARLKGVSYSVIVNLDGDTSFDEGYFAFLLSNLQEDPALGVVGTPIQETSGIIYDFRYVSIEHVSGACQVFRRECFEEIGGYVPSKAGGIDHVAVLTARMKGWKTRTFLEKVCHHHRKMGTAESGALMVRFKAGALDYALGSHPLWELFRTVYQMSRKPFVVGGLFLGAGYGWSLLRNGKRTVSSELVSFRRGEQMKRLKKLFSKSS